MPSTCAAFTWRQDIWITPALIALFLVPLAAEAQVVTFPDLALESAVRAELNKPTGDITEADMATLSILNAGGTGVADLTGLEHATNLSQLIMGSSPLSDLNPLSGLISLHSLELSDCNVSDLSPLTGLTNLVNLYLSRNPIGSVSPLGGLTRLHDLRLEGCGLTTITGLGTLANLQLLVLNDNELSNADELATLTSLVTLSIGDNQLTDLAPLAALVNLTGLDAHRNQLTDISALGALTALTNLGLSSNPISDIGSLSGLVNLTALFLANAQISDISALANTPELVGLELTNNQIADVGALEGLTNLETLFLGQNQIADIAPLAANTGLGTGDYVQLRQNPLDNVSLCVYVPEIQSRGATVEFTGACVGNALHVTIQPPGARYAGAAWRRVGTTTWFPSGHTETNVAPGDHTIEFSPLTHWSTPANQQATTGPELFPVLTGTYTRVSTCGAPAPGDLDLHSAGLPLTPPHTQTVQEATGGLVSDPTTVTAHLALVEHILNDTAEPHHAQFRAAFEANIPIAEAHFSGIEDQFVCISTLIAAAMTIDRNAWHTIVTEMLTDRGIDSAQFPDFDPADYSDVPNVLGPNDDASGDGDTNLSLWLASGIDPAAVASGDWSGYSRYIDLALGRGGPKYRLGTTSDMLDAAFYSGQVADGSNVAGRMALWGTPSNNGKSVAFWAMNKATFSYGLFVVDFGSPDSWRRLTPDVAGTPGGIAWVPDDSAIIVLNSFATETRYVNAQTGASTPMTWFGYTLRGQMAGVTQLSNHNWLVARVLGADDQLVCVPILRDGMPDPSRQPVQVTRFNPGTLVVIEGVSISADASNLVFSAFLSSGPHDRQGVYGIPNLHEVLSAPKVAGTDTSNLAPSSLVHPRILPIRAADTTQGPRAPKFTQDNQRVVYSEDWNKAFVGTNFVNSLAQSDFDVMITRADGTNTYRIYNAGNQGAVVPTRGGGRLIYIAAVNDPFDIHLFAASLEVRTTVAGNVIGNPADTVIEVTDDTHAQDASGTTILIPTGTIVDFPDNGPAEIQITTPIDPAQDPQLPGDVDALPVLRQFGPSGTTFSNPIPITISYTDDEVAGMNPATIRIFLYNEISGNYDIEVLDIVDRDFVNRTITFLVDHFSVYGLGINEMNLGTDTDSDGIPDWWELAYGLDPLDAGDAGEIWDADGLTNLEEYLYGTDPHNPDSDGDGLLDGDEVYVYGTNPANEDTSGNGIPDGWLVNNGLDPLDPGVADEDSDHDGFTNFEEYLGGSDPHDPQSVPPTLPWRGAYLLSLLVVFAGGATIRRRLARSSEQR